MSVPQGSRESIDHRITGSDLQVDLKFEIMLACSLDYFHVSSTQDIIFHIKHLGDAQVDIGLD